MKKRGRKDTVVNEYNASKRVRKSYFDRFQQDIERLCDSTMDSFFYDFYEVISRKVFEDTRAVYRFLNNNTNHMPSCWEYLYEDLDNQTRHELILKEFARWALQVDANNNCAKWDKIEQKKMITKMIETRDFCESHHMLRLLHFLGIHEHTPYRAGAVKASYARLTAITPSRAIIHVMDASFTKHEIQIVRARAQRICPNTIYVTPREYSFMIPQPELMGLTEEQVEEWEQWKRIIQCLPQLEARFSARDLLPIVLKYVLQPDLLFLLK